MKKKFKGKDISFYGDFDKVDFEKFINVENGFWEFIEKINNNKEMYGNGNCMSFYYNTKEKFYNVILNLQIQYDVKEKYRNVFSKIEYGKFQSIEEIKEQVKLDFDKLK